jgi:hypothetical protein
MRHSSGDRRHAVRPEAATAEAREDIAGNSNGKRPEARTCQKPNAKVGWVTPAKQATTVLVPRLVGCSARGCLVTVDEFTGERQ